MAENSQSNKVYEYVLDKIKTRTWTQGDKIYSENELCKKLDVSRIAVREALEKVSALGILEKKKGAGTYVSEMDLAGFVNNIIPLISFKPVDLLEVLRFRQYFERGNIIEFMKYHDADDVKALEREYEVMKQHTEVSEDFYVADFEFHMAIARGTKNPIIIAINEVLTGILVATQELINLKIGPEIGIRYHKDILNAIKHDDPEMAALLMTRHIEATIREVEMKMADEASS